MKTNIEKTVVAKSLGIAVVPAKIRTLPEISQDAPVDCPTRNSFIKAKLFK